MKSNFVREENWHEKKNTGVVDGTRIDDAACGMQYGEC